MKYNLNVMHAMWGDVTPDALAWASSATLIPSYNAF